MANRRFYQFRQALEPVVCDLFLHASMASNGVATLDASQSRGIRSIETLGAGEYIIHFQDNYNRLLMAQSLFIGVAASPGPDMRVSIDNVDDSSDPYVKVVFSQGQLTAPYSAPANPADGELRMQFTLKNSNA